MSHDDLVIIGRVLGALAIGAMIGFERTFHGRPAGFRTHSLVCIASALLMIVTVYQNEWMTHVAQDAIRTDPTRMAQGIMTGIGFLGAGVIMKEGLSVRGLTTAASIWITAAIGILVGIGFYFPAALATAITLGTLSIFRWIEAWMPAQFYAHHMIRFPRGQAMSEKDLRALIAEHGFSIANLSYRMTGQGAYLEYRMSLRTKRPENQGRLAETLSRDSAVVGFHISPTGD
jgi:putative Mg2+ transporter-C (MgtC) family protein